MRVTDISLCAKRFADERRAAVVLRTVRTLRGMRFAVGGDDDEEGVGAEILFWVDEGACPRLSELGLK